MPTHPAIGKPNYIFPKHYTPSTAHYDLSVSFETCAGARFAGHDFCIPAGTCGTWMLRFVNNEADLPAGALVAILRFDCQFYHRAQTDKPRGRDFTTLETDSDAELELTPGRGQALAWVRVAKRALKQGESFTVRLGDRRQGSVGSEVYWTTTECEMLAAVDADGSGEFVGGRTNPFKFEIVAHHELKRLRLLGPTVAAVGEPFAVHLVAFDRNRNVIESFEGEVDLHAPAGLARLPKRVAFAREHKGIRIISGVYAKQPGVFRIEARSDALGDQAESSNPIVVSAEPALRVFWGDPHCHGWGDDSMYLMSRRTRKLDPRSRHDQARRVGRFDFGAPGPMALPFEQREEIWEAYRNAAAEVDEPGRYAPLLSYEAHPPEGDRNVIFRSLDEPAPSLPYRTPMAELDALYGERDDTILEVHIGGAAPRWDRYRPQRERLVEVVSGFGNAEWLLQRALRHGYRPGLAGASDLHVGLLGGPRAVETFRGRFGYSIAMNQRDSGYGSGPLTAAIGPELNRDALWQALTTGRTYATTGARIYLSLECNNQGAGESVEVGDKLTVDITCHACAEIERVDLLAGDRCIGTWRPAALDFALHEELDAARVPGRWLYVRVRQVDAEYAWSALVWLERDEAPSGEDYPLWNAHEPADADATEAAEAKAYLDAVKRYLATEEDAALFQELTPIRVVHESMGAAALFHCYYGPERVPMSVRWFFEFEIPKIRFDFGWRDFGWQDELELGG